uniref:Uncharacterized protein n=1 Tax=Opuntia streptacantha TaxID=393608 RepID=A0A7C9DGF3_OPUST
MRPSGIPQAGSLEEEGRRREVAAGCNNSLWVNLCFLVVKTIDEENAFIVWRGRLERENLGDGGGEKGGVTWGLYRERETEKAAGAGGNRLVGIQTPPNEVRYIENSSGGSFPLRNVHLLPITPVHAPRNLRVKLFILTRRYFLPSNKKKKKTQTTPFFI